MRCRSKVKGADVRQMQRVGRRVSSEDLNGHAGQDTWDGQVWVTEHAMR